MKHGVVHNGDAVEPGLDHVVCLFGANKSQWLGTGATQGIWANYTRSARSALLPFFWLGGFPYQNRLQKKVGTSF